MVQAAAAALASQVYISSGSYVVRLENVRRSNGKNLTKEFQDLTEKFVLLRVGDFLPETQKSGKNYFQSLQIGCFFKTATYTHIYQNLSLV